MHCIRKTIMALTCAVAFSPVVLAQTGSNGYNFLDITSSARIYGLGGVNISTVDDNLEVADQNPGLLGPEMSGQTAINYSRYFSDSNIAGIRYSHSAGERGAWAASITYMGYGEIKSTDITGAELGNFSPMDVTFAGSYAHDLSEHWRGGFSIKAVYSSYDIYTAWAIATDLGVNYYDPDRDFSFSAVIANLGGQVKKFDDRSTSLPTDVRIGFTKGLVNLPFRFSVTAWHLTKWNLPYYKAVDAESGEELVKKDSFGANLLRHLVFGVDFVPSDRFYVSLGYNYKTHTDMARYSRSFFSGWSAGAGFNANKMSVALAYAQPHAGASVLMLTLSLNLPKFLK